MRRLLRCVAAASAFAAVISCQGDVTAPGATPSRAPAGHGASANLTSADVLAYVDTVLVIRRLETLSQDETVSAVIGPEGGRLSLSDVGATLTVPPGALAAPTTISMTARAGPFVAYEFEPHGTHFPVALTFEQDLRGTWAAKSRWFRHSLQGAYYDSDLTSAFVDPWQLFARVVEERPSTLDHSGHHLTFTIEHFSGYLLSSGRGGRGN